MSKSLVRKIVVCLIFQIKSQKGLETRITNSAGINRRDFTIEKIEKMSLYRILRLVHSLLCEDEKVLLKILREIRELINLDIEESDNNSSNKLKHE